jgi:HNH endonuclease
VPIVERNGEPLRVGRRARTVPAALRRALNARDGPCQYPGCERCRFVDAHQIEHWAHGGEMSLDNLVLLCRHHHRLVHEGGARVVAFAHGPRFYAPDGTELSPPSPPGSRPGLLEVSNRAHAIDPDAGTILNGTGERMDLRLCVDAALAAGDWWRPGERPSQAAAVNINRRERDPVADRSL